MTKRGRPSQDQTLGPPALLDGSAGVYLFVGGEPLLRRLQLNQLVARALGIVPAADDDRAVPAEASMAVSQFDGPAASLASVMDELRTMPFLAERRVVILQDADPFISENRAALEAYLEKPCPTGLLVLLAESERANTNLARAVAARGGLVACHKLAAGELAGWIRQRAQQTYGKNLDYETAGLLADLVGDDLGRLDSELAKLASYLGPERKTVTADDVDKLVANHRMHDAFELTAAIASRDTAAALTRWDDMLAKDRSAEFTALALIAWQVRQLLRARLLRRQGLSREDVFRRLRLPFHVRDRFVEQVSRFTDRRLQVLLSELVRVDLAAKTGGMPADRGIEQFIIVACHDGS